MENVLDDRSVFANKVFKLLFEKHKGDIDSALKEAESYFFHFHEHVRNIYELISTEIPLMYYNDLLKYGKDDFGMTESEYQNALIETKNKCKIFYS